MPTSLVSDSGSAAARLDRLGGTPAVWRLIVLVSLGGCFEYYDLFLTGYLSPGLVRAGIFGPDSGLFGLSGQATFTAATFAGLFLGTVAFAAVADRFGRRTIFTISLLWYTVATLAMSAQNSALGVDLWRFVSGIGIGVELVTIDAYITELAPKEVRGRAFALSQAIQFLAVPIVALLCWLLVPLDPLGIAGWRWVLIVGATGAIAIWWLRSQLPESPRWLISKGRFTEAERIVAAIEGRDGGPSSASLPAADSDSRGAAAILLHPPYRSRMLMLVVFNIFQTIGFYGFGNWVPSLIAAQGADVIHSLLYSSIIAIAYPVAPLLCLAIADRYERKWQIIAAATGTAAFGLLFSHVTTPVALIGCGVLITFTNNLLSYAFHAYQAELFPTRIRARAVGFVYAWSRLSTVFTSFLIAFFLRDFGAEGVFAFIAASMGVVVLSIGFFGPATGNRALEDVSGAPETAG